MDDTLRREHPAASAPRAALVEYLASRTLEMSDEIAGLIEDKIDRVRTEKVEREWVRLSTQANCELLHHLVGHPDDLAVVEPPVGAMSLVRQLARQGMPLYEIFRAYQLGQARWDQICTQFLSTLTSDAKVLASEVVTLSALSNGYVDKTCSRIAIEYEEERGRWLRREESRRLDRVLALLSGAATDTDDAERALGYRLRQHHQAVVAWVDPADREGDESVRAERAVAAARELLEGRGRSLVLTHDARKVWAWIPQPARTLDLSALEERIRAEDPSVRIALGERSRGVVGFRSSHRQAEAAYEVGRLSHAATIFPYRDVSALTLLVSDPSRARDWVNETLGDLASDAPRVHELRRTLRVYLESQQSPTIAARNLNCHKNTVQYRLRTIEQALGRAIDSDPLNIGLALQAHRWLGAEFFATL